MVEKGTILQPFKIHSKGLKALFSLEIIKVAVFVYTTMKNGLHDEMKLVK